MSRPIPPAYKTRNWPAYNEALKRRGSLTIWFDSAMTWEATPTGKRGRQPDYSDAAIQTCLTMKVLFGMALAAERRIVVRRIDRFRGRKIRASSLDDCSGLDVISHPIRLCNSDPIASPDRAPDHIAR